MNGFQLLEHTADMGIAAQGETRAELFRQMALGLRQIITSCAKIRPEIDVEVDISGKDGEELLVNWLGELVFLLETRLFLFAEIDIWELTGHSLKARLRGETYDPERHYLEREIKAVTYHQVKLEAAAEGWAAQVYVDL